MIIEAQFFTSNNLPHRVYIHLCVEQIRFAIWFATMIDESSLVPVPRTINGGAFSKAKHIYRCRFPLSYFNLKLCKRDTFSCVFNDARPFRYFSFGK